jgi:hypothetical protein
MIFHAKFKKCAYTMSALLWSIESIVLNLTDKQLTLSAIVMDQAVTVKDSA